ncbi:MAG TPA: acetate--CoA ligase family protein, partial [Polyangiaceae bacterium]|nr:acetate--CoA ligase family protein [Polyangiaceae bacterium]
MNAPRPARPFGPARSFDPVRPFCPPRPAAPRALRFVAALGRSRHAAPHASLLLVALALGACAPAEPAASPTSAASPTPVASAAASPRVRAEGEASIQRARALALAGDFDAAEGLLRAAIERAGGAGDARALARLQAELADSQSQASFYRNRGADEVVRLAAEAQASAQRAGDRGAQAKAVGAEAMVRYGRLLWGGGKDFSEPRALFERSLALWQAAGDAPGVAHATFHVGLTYEQEGKGPRARELYERALALAERAGDRSTMAYALRHLAGFHEEAGDLDRALDRLAAIGAARYLVEAMAPSGVDLIAAARRDPVFGPVVLVGLGGTTAEAVADVAIRLAPIEPARAAA